jgi:hypothetical protein
MRWILSATVALVCLVGSAAPAKADMSVTFTGVQKFPMSGIIEFSGQYSLGTGDYKPEGTVVIVKTNNSCITAQGTVTFTTVAGTTGGTWTALIETPGNGSYNAKMNYTWYNGTCRHANTFNDPCSPSVTWP